MMAVDGLQLHSWVQDLCLGSRFLSIKPLMCLLSSIWWTLEFFHISELLSQPTKRSRPPSKRLCLPAWLRYNWLIVFVVVESPLPPPPSPSQIDAGSLKGERWDPLHSSQAEAEPLRRLQLQKKHPFLSAAGSVPCRDWRSSSQVLPSLNRLRQLLILSVSCDSSSYHALRWYTRRTVLIR